MRAGLVLLVLLLAVDAASAQSERSEAAEQEARARFEAGRQLVESNSFLAARAEFQRGFEYSLRPLFLFNMAECARELGDGETARREYSEYLRMEPEGNFAVLATTRLEALGPGDTRTPEFVTGARTQLRARIHLEHGIEAYQASHHAEALDEFEQAYRVAEDPNLLFHIAMAHQQLEHVDLAIEHFERFLAEALPGAADRPVAEAQRDALLAERETSSEDGSSSNAQPSTFGLRGGAIVSLAVSGAALLSMVVSGAMTLSLRAELNDQGCAATGCDPADVDSLVRRARTFDVSAGLSLAAFATGLALLLVAPDESSTGVRIAPSVAMNEAGLVLQGGF